MKIGAITDHAQALAAYTAAGHPFPAIPAGKNTVWHHFRTVDGLPAVIVNQSGGAPTAEDNEEQVNGCTLLVAIDAPDPETARATLEKQVRELLELPRLGRPPKDDAKNAVVRVRCELAEKGRWVQEARKHGKKLSEWMRDLANGAS